MTKAFALAIAPLAMLAACGDQAREAPPIEPKADAPADAKAGDVSVLGAAVSGEAAKKIMHDRHEGMEDIGDAFKALNRELKGDSPNLDSVRKFAATIDRLAGDAATWFPAGTGPDVGKTRAKPAIWEKPTDFAAKAKQFDTLAAALAAAAQGTDIDAIRASAATLGKNCKACHDPYRAEEKGHD